MADVTADVIAIIAKKVPADKSGSIKASDSGPGPAARMAWESPNTRPAAAGDEEGNELGVASEDKAAVPARPAARDTHKAPSHPRTR